MHSPWFIWQNEYLWLLHRLQNVTQEKQLVYGFYVLWLYQKHNIIMIHSVHDFY